MDLDELYNKLPKKIKYSEKFILVCMKIASFFRRKGEISYELDYTLDYLFKSPDIKIQGTLRNIQLLFTELLRFIDNVCKKYDLDYFLAYGTLLGAIRHEGFIPWDDDCDIFMLRKDYNKLIEVLPQEINKNEFLKKNMALTKLISFEENYFKDCNTLYDKDLGHDDYFYDYNKGPEKLRGIDNINLPRVSKSLFLQVGWLKPMLRLDIFPHDFIKEDSLKFYEKYHMAYKVAFRNSFLDSDFKYDDDFNRRFEELGLSVDETDFIGGGIDSSVNWYGIYDKDMFLPAKTVKFEDYYFKCPNKPIELLEKWYGDSYMDIPSNIEMHGYSEYNSSLFESDSEMNLSFERAIKELKKINDDFK